MAALVPRFATITALKTRASGDAPPAAHSLPLLEQSRVAMLCRGRRGAGTKPAIAGCRCAPAQCSGGMVFKRGHLCPRKEVGKSCAFIQCRGSSRERFHPIHTVLIRGVCIYKTYRNIHGNDNPRSASIAAMIPRFPSRCSGQGLGTGGRR